MGLDHHTFWVVYQNLISSIDKDRAHYITDEETIISILQIGSEGISRISTTCICEDSYLGDSIPKPDM